MARWVGGRVANGGGELAGEHTLPCTPSGTAETLGQDRNVDAAYPLITRV